MPTVELEKKEDLQDFVRGVTFYGTGGGGDPKKGLDLLLKDLEIYKKILWKDIEEVSEEGWSACPFFMGSIAPETPEIKQKKVELGLTNKTVENPLINAIKELEQYTGKTIDVIVPVELGGGNTPGPLDVAIKAGKILVDGDYSGRAIPEIVQITPHIFGKKLTPITAVDEYGNIVIIRETINNVMAERIGKLISVGAFGHEGEAGILLKVDEMKKILIPGTLTRSLEVGRVIREAREKGKDPVEAAIEKVSGYLLFEGIVIEKEWEDREGYMWGTHTFKGIGKFEGRTFKIWFKNENHISWLDNEVYVTSPDLIVVVRRKDAEPITNTDLKEGEEVAIIGIKANEKLRTPEALTYLGPKHFGFEYKYVPIEKIVE